LSGIRARLTYANVMATLAVFIALGGSSYAALKIDGRDVRARSIPGNRLKGNALGGTEIAESRLGTVPRAENAALLGGLTAEQLLVRCPADTFAIAGTCIERTARPPSAYGSAVLTCTQVGRPAAPGRRLPTHGELSAALTAFTLADGGELTSDVIPSSSLAGHLDVIYVTDQVGGIATTTDNSAGAKAYRCAADPMN